MQLPEPTLVLNVPEEHVEQLPLELPPQPLRYRPAGHPPHVLQPPEPVLVLKAPEGHVEQLPLELPPQPLLYCPAGHSSHGLHAPSPRKSFPLALNVPAAHDKGFGHYMQSACIRLRSKFHTLQFTYLRYACG